MELEKKYRMLAPLVMARLDALKSQGKTPKSTKPRSKEYQKGVSDSIWILQDLFESLSFRSK